MLHSFIPPNGFYMIHLGQHGHALTQTLPLIEYKLEVDDTNTHTHTPVIITVSL